MSCEGTYLDIFVELTWRNGSLEKSWSERVGVDPGGRPKEPDGVLKWNPDLMWPGQYDCIACGHYFDDWWQVEKHWEPVPHEDCNDLLQNDVCSDCGEPVRR